MPIASLAGPYGIGTLGKSARRFVDFLNKSGQRVWQILPLTPTSFGDSPYQSPSAFAGNPYFIDLDALRRKGLLKKGEYESEAYGSDPRRVDYAAMYQTRYAVLRKAFARFAKWFPDDYYRFCWENREWIEDYALFMTAKGLNGGRAYLEWEDDALRRHDRAALDRLYAEKEALPENEEFVRINNKRTLAQVFTDIRYTKANNEHFSEVLLRTLREQGFMGKL